MVWRRLVLQLLLTAYTGLQVIAAPPLRPYDNVIAVRSDPGSTKDNPIEASFDISGWESIAEQDCYAILCHRNAELVYQRNDGSADSERRRSASGAALKPFSKGELSRRHTAQINPKTSSAEEFPWASTQQGGLGALVFPATEEEQRFQGSHINDGLGKVPYGHWFRIRFVGQPLGHYCSALFHPDGPQTDICNRADKVTLFGTAGVILANFVYQELRNGRPFTFANKRPGQSHRLFRVVEAPVNVTVFEIQDS